MNVSTADLKEYLDFELSSNISINLDTYHNSISNNITSDRFFELILTKSLEDYQRRFPLKHQNNLRLTGSTFIFTNQYDRLPYDKFTNVILIPTSILSIYSDVRLLRFTDFSYRAPELVCYLSGDTLVNYLTKYPFNTEYVYGLEDHRVPIFKKYLLLNYLSKLVIHTKDFTIPGFESLYSGSEQYYDEIKAELETYVSNNYGHSHLYT